MTDPNGKGSVADAAARFFPKGTVQSVEGRDWLLRVDSDERSYSVRALDPALPATRIDLIHELLASPDLQYATQLVKGERAGGGGVFDARVWIEGEPAGSSIPRERFRTIHLPTNLEEEALASTAAALALFHRTGSTTSLVARAPRFRIRDWLAGVRKSLTVDERRLAGEIRKESRARRWLTASRPLLASAERSLEEAGFLTEELEVLAHLDLWGSHMVIAGPEDVALLDFARIAAAPPAVDLAQLIARNGAWTGDRLEVALSAYSRIAPLSPLQRRMLPWLGALDGIASCGRLLALAQGEGNRVDDRTQRTLLASADQPLDLLQSLVEDVIPKPRRTHYRKPAQRPRKNRPS